MNNIGWYKACRLIMGAIAKDGPALKVINWLNLQSSDTVNLSYRLIGKETDTARMTVFEAIERLVKIGAIVVETTGKRTIAKIVTPENFKDNYEKTDRTISGHPTGHPTGHSDQDNSEIFTIGCDDLETDGRTPNRTPNRTTSGHNRGVLVRSKNKNKQEEILCHSANDSAAPATHETNLKPIDAAALWNTRLPNHTQNQITLLSKNPKRLAKIKALLDTVGIDGINTAIEKISASSFLSGKNDRQWKPNLSWLTNMENYQKVVEGNFDDLKPNNQTETGSTGELRLIKPGIFRPS